MFQSRYGIRMSIGGLFAAALGLGLGASLPFTDTVTHHRTGAGRRTLYTRWRQNGSGWGSRPVSGGGPLERARRIRQIAAGSLRVENGLWIEGAPA